MAWKYYDFRCTKCQHVFNDLVCGDTAPDPCPKCGNTSGFTREHSGFPTQIKTIVVSYPGSKQFKAGYQHSHNRAAEKSGSQVSMLPSKRR